MSEWHPSAILQEPGLRLTDEEKADILRRMPPPSSEDGEIYIDAVFEGGGVRGLAFLGAARCIADLGFHWRKVAGTSAGAITAATVAANFTIDDLEKIIGRMDYMQFLTKKTSWLILDNKPEDDLQSPVGMMLWLLLSRQLGQYSSEPFYQWLSQILAEKGITNFSDIQKKSPKKDLKVVTSDISRGEMLVLPDDLDLPDPLDPQGRSLRQQLNFNSKDEFGVAEAVRLSMSIPLFFAPGQLGDRKMVDGGILSNFPLWIYDFRPSGTDQKCPRWPTFGFRLVEKDNQNSQDISGPFDLLGAIFRTMMVARDQYHLKQTEKDRVIELDITEAKTTATEFNLVEEKKSMLYRLGYLCTKTFFLKTWDWETHLRQRGYDPADLVP
jgi:NTE family protein